MADYGQGGQKACPGCGEDVENGWVKCPVCNFGLIAQKTPVSTPVPVPPGPPQTIAPAPVPPPSLPEAPSLPSSLPVVPGPPERPMTPGLPLASDVTDMSKGEEAHRISESATVKSKLDAVLKDKDDRDARVKALEIELQKKDAAITGTEQSLAVERMEKENLKQKLEMAETKLAKQQSSGGDIDELKKKLEDTETRLAQQESERKSLEDLVVQREEGLKNKDDEHKTRDETLAQKEVKNADDREKIKAQAVALAEIEAKVEAKEKALAEREAALTKDEADMDQVEAGLKERESVIVHGHEQLKIKQGELDGMVDQYANRLATVKHREDKANELEKKTKELAEKNEKDRTELGQSRVLLETEKADITTRSHALFERLQKAEAKGKELDERERVVKETEHKAQRWQEDLRHTEIHLMSIQDDINRCVYCSAKDRFMMVDKLIADAKAIGAETDMAETEVKNARVLLDAGEFEKAIEKASAAIKLAETSKKQYYSYGVRYTIKTVEKIIASIKELGVSTEEPESMLKDAKKSLAEEDYERAEDSAKMAERIALYTEEKAEEISSGVRRLDSAIAKAKTDGRDVGTAQGLIEQAKDLAKKGNYGSSLDYLREAEKSLMEQQVSSLSEGLKEEPAEAAPPPPGPPPPVVEAPAPEPVPEPAPVLPPVVETPYVEQTQQTIYSAGGPVHYQAQQQQYEPQVQAPPPQPQAPETPGQRFRCPYCQSVFEVRANYRPVTTACPYCTRVVMIN